MNCFLEPYAFTKDSIHRLSFMKLESFWQFVHQLERENVQEKKSMTRPAIALLCMMRIRQNFSFSLLSVIFEEPKLQKLRDFFWQSAIIYFGYALPIPRIWTSTNLEDERIDNFFAAMMDKADPLFQLSIAHTSTYLIII